MVRIRILSTTFEGKPIPGSGEVFEADSFLELVQIMQYQSPFSAEQEPLEYMAGVLNRIAQEEPTALPCEPEKAADVFVDELLKRGFVQRV